MAKNTAFYGVQDVSVRALARLSTEDLLSRLDVAKRDTELMTGHEGYLARLEKQRIEDELVSRA